MNKYKVEIIVKTNFLGWVMLVNILARYLNDDKEQPFKVEETVLNGVPVEILYFTFPTPAQAVYMKQSVERRIEYARESEFPNFDISKVVYVALTTHTPHAHKGTHISTSKATPILHEQRPYQIE